MRSKQIEFEAVKAELQAKFPPLLSIDEVADMLRHSVGTVRDWKAHGRLDGLYKKPGRRLTFLRDAVLDWFFNRPEELN